MPFQRSFFRRSRSGKTPSDVRKALGKTPSQDAVDALAFSTVKESPNETPAPEFVSTPDASTNDGKMERDNADFNDFSHSEIENGVEDESGSAERPAFVLQDGQIDWGAALRANESWLRATIAARVGESAAVDEVFQELALAATRQKAPIQNPRKIGAWLFRLATTYSLLYRRSIGRKKKALQKYEETLSPIENDVRQQEPLQWLLLEERRACIRQATALLPADEREILALKYSEGKSYKEIAEKTGSTVSAVQSKLFRARARLREKLAQLLPDNDI